MMINKNQGKITVITFFTFNFIFIFFFQYFKLDSIFYIFLFVISLPFLWHLGKIYDDTKRCAEFDSLTNFYNRHSTIKQFPKLIEQAKRKSESISIILIDIDNFKSINDSLGHNEGDKVLQLISKSLTKSIRKFDFICRWGGDEFIIVTPFAKKRNAFDVCKRIETNLQNIKNNQKPIYSLSYGVSTYPIDGENLEELIQLADLNMYKMKNKKKNLTQ